MTVYRESLSTNILCASPSAKLIPEPTVLTSSTADTPSPGNGLFSMGLWVNLPVGSDDGTIHPLISKGETVGYKVYEKDGNIYFSLDDGVSAVEEVSTVGSGINFADGEAHLIFVERDSRLTVPQLRIHVYKEFEKSENTTNTLITNSGFLYLGASGPNGAPDTNAFLGTKLSSFTYFRGKILSDDEKYEYWKHGVLPSNAIINAQLDEAYGAVIYDSSGYSNHGSISNYASGSRSVIKNGFSHQNQYGYSSGQYVINNGGTHGSPNQIDPLSYIPYNSANLEQDIFGNALEFAGRVRYNVKVVDAVCWKGNGKSSANVSNISKLEYVPGTDAFSVFWVAEEIEAVGGVLISAGTAPNYNYRYSYHASQNKIEWSVGSVSGSVAVSAGWRKVVVTVETSGPTQEVWVDGVSLGTTVVGTTVTPGFVTTLFADYNVSGNQNILSDGSVAMIGTKTGVMSAEDRAAFFADDMVPPSDPDALWVPCSQGSTIFDLSKNMQHALVESLASTAWEGKQSITTYLANGFHKIYQFPKESSDFIIVPFDVDGKPIPHSEYGSLQVVAKHVSKDGHNLFDCYIDMTNTPLNLVLGCVITIPIVVVRSSAGRY